jgi:membrane-associated phospholipid phosphatase
MTYAAAIGALNLVTGALIPGHWVRALLYVVTGLAVAALVRLADDDAAWSVVRAVYPLPLLLFWWGQLEYEIPLLWDSYWSTDWLVRADMAVFGGHPSTLIQAYATPIVDELLAFCYLSYYLFLAVPLVLVICRRLDEAVAAYGAVMLTYVMNFGLFIVLPAKSPPQILQEYPDLAPRSLSSSVLGNVVLSLQASDGVTGAAFPSSHIAGSMVCTLVALRYLPPLGRALLPLLMGMSVATVYLGYHHAVDPIAGLLLGTLGYALAARSEPTLRCPLRE